MAIRITEIETDANTEAGVDESLVGRKTFKVEGTLHLKDAELLERICSEEEAETGRSLIIELSNICFVDQASANVLCRMKRERGVEIRGMNLFIKKVMEMADQGQTVDLPPCS